MSMFSDKVINKTYEASHTYGHINQGVKELLQLLDPQSMNIFEILLIPDSLPEKTKVAVSNGMGMLEYAARSVLDTVVTKLHVQTMDIGFNALEYARYDYHQGITDITYADEVTITFIENELGIVRNFLNNWLKLTMKKDFINGGYRFNDNQWTGRKKAIIIPQMSVGLPSTAWIELKGLRFKSMDNWAFDQASPDPLKISVTFAIDECWLLSPL